MEKTIYLVLSDNGDGSSSINWFSDCTEDELRELEERWPDRWSSGDGIQITKIVIPDIDAFLKANPYICIQTIEQYKKDYVY